MTNALIPTSLPLPPQDLTPDEVAEALAEATDAHAAAVEALRVAQDHFDAAERRRAYAQSEEEKRLAREEQARIQKMRDLYPQVEKDIARHRERFFQAAAAEVVKFDDVMLFFNEWSRNHAALARMNQEITRYDSQQSRDDYMQWLRRVYGWGELIRTVTSWRKGGTLPGEDDDLVGLAAVNERIEQESQDAPRALKRDPQDQSTPFIEDLGLRDPVVAGASVGYNVKPIELADALSEAFAKASQVWAGRILDDLSERARIEYTARENARAEGN